MTEFLLAAAVLALAIVGFALARLLYSRQPLDWIMAVELLGTAGIAALLLVGTATASPGAIDLALLLALLAAFATLAFTASIQTRTGIPLVRPQSTLEPKPETEPEQVTGAGGAHPDKGPQGPSDVPKDAARGTGAS